MGGGDLNMKKSWHPVLLSNQARVWEVEKKAHEEKKKLDQLRKEIEEERQLLELQRLQEESTGRKRVEKLDWMYASPATADGGALGGAKLGERQMEDYLLGKKRVDEVLKLNEENIGATSEKFQAVQSANDALDLASKIREDPMLAIKRQEQVAYQAMLNDPALRRQVKEMKRQKGESKEEKRERKRREKEEKKAAKKEEKHSRHHHHHHDRHDGRSRYSDDDYGSRSDERDRYDYRRSERPRSRSRSPPSRRGDDRDRDARDRSYASKYDSREQDYRQRGSAYGGYGRDERDRSGPAPYRRGGSRSRSRSRDRYDDKRSSGRIDRDRHNNVGGNDRTDDRASSRPSAPPAHIHPARLANIPNAPIDIKPTSAQLSSPSATTSAANPSSDRAARLAQMAADAESATTSRLATLEARRLEQERREADEARERERFGKQDTKGAYVREQERMMLGGSAGGAGGLGDVLGRRGGKGLIREDV